MSSRYVCTVSGLSGSTSSAEMAWAMRGTRSKAAAAVMAPVAAARKPRKYSCRLLLLVLLLLMLLRMLLLLLVLLLLSGLGVDDAARGFAKERWGNGLVAEKETKPKALCVVTTTRRSRSREHRISTKCGDWGWGVDSGVVGEEAKNASCVLACCVGEIRRPRRQGSDKEARTPCRLCVCVWRA